MFGFLSFFFLFHFSFIITVSPYSDPSMRLESAICCPPFVLALILQLIWFDLLSSYYGLRGIGVLKNLSTGLIGFSDRDGLIEE